MQNNMKKDYLWNTIGVFAQNAISPLLLIVITRINGISISGLFSFAFSVSILFWAIGLWGGRTYQVSDTKKEFSQRSYLTVRLLLAAVMIVGAVIFTVISGYDTEKTQIILALVVFKVIESIADVIYGVLQIHGRLYIAGKSLLYKAVLGIGSFIAVDLVSGSILLASLAVVVINLVILFAYDIRHVKKNEDLRIERGKVFQYLKEASVILKRCFPVFAVSFLAMLSINIPRYFIDSYHPEEIGYFGIIVMPVTLIALVISFILQPNVVELATLYNGRKYDDFKLVVRKLLRITLLVGGVIVLTTALLGVQLLELAFGVGFETYRWPLLVVILGGIANALVFILINILTIMRKIRSQMYVLLVSNIGLLIVSVVCSSFYGLPTGVSLFAAVNIVQFAALYMAYISRLKNGRINAKEA